MGKINYKAIYDKNKDDWKAMTREPQKYEELLAGHYSDCNHFIYELLQNAEDAFEVDENGKFNPETCAFADRVVIEYYEDKLVFYHNGKPFDEDDVIGIASMLMGTKDREDAQTIGRFGMGFKSVYKYTYQPEIYSDDEAFRIVHYLLPEEIEEGWNCKLEKESLIYSLTNGEVYVPFLDSKHLTKIVIPFKKYDKKGGLISINGDDILLKLRALDSNILLFLTRIKSLFWIDKTSKKEYDFYTLKVGDDDENYITCKKKTSRRFSLSNEVNYLKYTLKFDAEEMNNAEVSVAYPLTYSGDKIDISNRKESVLNVYFPTEDHVKFPFLTHGSFETAVSREKIIKPSRFNNNLMSQLSSLIADSLIDLARRKLITQEFIRNALIPSFIGSASSYVLRDFKAKVVKIFCDNAILPDATGKYRRASSLVVAVPFELANLKRYDLFEKIMEKRRFVALNNIYYGSFSEYYDFLVNDLKIPLYTIETLVDDSRSLENKKIMRNTPAFNDLLGVYKVIDKVIDALQGYNQEVESYNVYNTELKNLSEIAMDYIKKCPLVLNQDNVLKPVITEKGQYLFIPTEDSPLKLEYGEYISGCYSLQEVKFLEKVFDIPQKDTMNDIKQNILSKYMDENIAMKIDEDEYIEDIKMLYQFMNKDKEKQMLQDFIKDAYIIRIISGNGKVKYARPSWCLARKSEEKVNMEIYFDKIMNKLNEEDRFYFVDWEFYKENGIPVKKIKNLGLNTQLVYDGKKENYGDGDNCWRALDDYCPEIRINGLIENLEYIEEHSNTQLAREKSREILILLMSISHKLIGKKEKRLRRNPYTSDIEEADILKYEIKRYNWLYDEKYKLRRTCEISRFELNDDLYSNVQISKDGASVLGFIEKNLDIADDMKNKFATFSEKEQQDFLSSIIETYGVDKIKNIYENDDVYFDVDSYNDVDFPVRKVTNKEYLKQHILEQFYCADPVRYEKVIRKTRVSKRHKVDRAYATGMYTNKTGKIVCQGCKKTTNYVDVVQLSNYGIEMPQFSLCLCKDCATKFKEIRSEDKIVFKNQIKEKVMDVNINNDDEYIIDVSEDMKLNFTQTHIMELQEIFDMINIYGIPSNSN